MQQSSDHIQQRATVSITHMSLPGQSHNGSSQTEKEQRLKAYLRERTRCGDRYFKSKYIANDLGLTSKEVGALMVKLRESATTVSIEKWSQTSPATWQVRPSSQASEPSSDTV